MNGIEDGVSWSVGHESDRYKNDFVLFISSYIILIIMGGDNELFKRQ